MRSHDGIEACAARETSPVVGVVLAGGRARRLGSVDKGLLELAGKTLLERTTLRLRAQTPTLILNANGDPQRFARFGLPVVPDVIDGFAGPLAGVLSGMHWARRQVPDAAAILTAPVDAPFLPHDLRARLESAMAASGAELACAGSGGRRHPVVGLWSVALAEDLESALREERIRKIDRWTARHRVVVVDWPSDPVDPFFNVNRPEDLAEARQLLRSGAAR